MLKTESSGDSSSASRPAKKAKKVSFSQETVSPVEGSRKMSIPYIVNAEDTPIEKDTPEVSENTEDMESIEEKNAPEASDKTEEVEMVDDIAVHKQWLDDGLNDLFEE